MEPDSSKISIEAERCLARSRRVRVDLDPPCSPSCADLGATTLAAPTPEPWPDRCHADRRRSKTRELLLQHSSCRPGTSLLAGVAGGVIVSSRMKVLATGVMVALAIIPSMALVGMGLVTGKKPTWRLARAVIGGRRGLRPRGGSTMALKRARCSTADAQCAADPEDSGGAAPRERRARDNGPRARGREMVHRLIQRVARRYPARPDAEVTPCARIEIVITRLAACQLTGSCVRSSARRA